MQKEYIEELFKQFIKEKKPEEFTQREDEIAKSFFQSNPDGLIFSDGEYVFLINMQAETFEVISIVGQNNVKVLESKTVFLQYCLETHEVKMCPTIPDKMSVYEMAMEGFLDNSFLINTSGLVSARNGMGPFITFRADKSHDGKSMLIMCVLPNSVIYAKASIHGGVMTFLPRKDWPKFGEDKALVA